MHLIQAVRGFMPDPLETLSAARTSVAEPVLAGLSKMHHAIGELWGRQRQLAKLAWESGR